MPISNREKKQKEVKVAIKTNYLRSAKRTYWKCPDCGTKHYYDPKDVCRLPCGYRGRFYPDQD